MSLVAATACASARPCLPFAPSPRQARIAEHYALVHTLVARMARRYPSHVDTDELIEAGTLGLIDAVDRFDETRGVPFRGYAEIRIRGAIVDALRAADWVPRGVRRDGAQIEAARETLRRREGREPSAGEIAGELGLPLETVNRQRAQGAPRALVSLDGPTSEDAETLLGEVVPDTAPNPHDRCESADLGRAAARAVEALPERERVVVQLYYEGDLSLKEIGGRLGLSESRVCQLHGAAVQRLQRLLGRSAA
jgi:RNA polymerase sigma factor for flagellar operon FliA